MTQNLKAHLFVLFATFLVGSSFIVSQRLSGIIDPISITLLRFIIATLVLAPLILIIKKYRIKILPTFKRTMIMSFFYSVYFIGIFKALEYTSVLNTGTIFTLSPLLTAILAIFAFKQKITLKQLFVYIIGMIGTVIVIFQGDINLFLGLNLNIGDIIFLFATFCMALYSICAKYFYKKDDEMLVVVFMTLFGGIIWMSISMFIFDIPLQWDLLNKTDWSYLLYLSIAATLLTVFLYQNATVIIGPKKVMAYVYLNPATIAILLFIIEKNLINIKMLIGIVISSLATFILLKDK